MITYRFIQPLDMLYLRGNKLFGDPGSHGEALMPPWPSVAAGALRSRMMADHSMDAAILQDPKVFRVTHFGLGRRLAGEPVEPVMPLPADIFVGEDPEYLRPMSLPVGVTGSHPPDLQVPVLATRRQAKPEAGLWLNGAGWTTWLTGGPVLRDTHLVKEGDMWAGEQRLGIALEVGSGTAAGGALYTTETVALCSDPKGGYDVGFLVGVEGLTTELPRDGLLRFGGDGRGAALVDCQPILPEPDWERVLADKRFRLLLATPGIFPDGWCVPGLGRDHTWRGPDGIQARLISAAVPGLRVISGWDVKDNQPKPALRAVPPGAVYWFDRLEGDISGLRKLAEEGLWAVSDYPGPQRQAEGFNHVWVAPWARSE